MSRAPRWIMALLVLLLIVPALLVGAGLWYAIVFPRQPVTGPLPALTDEERDLAARLERHVTAIASEPHNLDHPEALEQAARYIEATLTGLGYAPERQTYEVGGRASANIEVVIAPAGATAATPTYVVGAHYDSAGRSPGANDNGTGVAATLELARLLKGWTPKASRLRLVLWTNEEAPYAHTPDMGSFRHAQRLKDAGETVAGAISLETLGYFSDEPGSQKFPSPFDLVYDDRGNFAAFVGLPGSRAFVRAAIGAFRKTTVFPTIGGVAPGSIPGIDHSDHWSYHQFSWPALMLTDTAPFRNPQYHRTTDLPATVDYASLARITKGCERMLREIVQ